MCILQPARNRWTCTIIFLTEFISPNSSTTLLILFNRHVSLKTVTFIQTNSTLYIWSTKDNVTTKPFLNEWVELDVFFLDSKNIFLSNLRALVGVNLDLILGKWDSNLWPNNIDVSNSYCCFVEVKLSSFPPHEANISLPELKVVVFFLYFKAFVKLDKLN